jgi:hypothetical protein
MSIEYFAYQIPSSLVGRLEKNSTIFFQVFWEADLVEDFEEFQEYAKEGGLDFSELGEDALAIFTESKHSESFALDVVGYFAESLHLLLSGEDMFYNTPDFIVKNQNGLLLINALIGIHKIDVDMDAFYLSPAEVKEVATALPRITEEDLDRRRSLFYPKARYNFYPSSEVTKFIADELLPLYESSSEQDSGILIAISA